MDTQDYWPVNSSTLAQQYYDWCMKHPNPYRDTCGRYGPEFRMRVDAPIDKLAELLREAGYEPTMERLDLLLPAMQEQFSDKHGGCPPGEVEGRIVSEAYETVTLLAENGDLEEDDAEEEDVDVDVDET